MKRFLIPILLLLTLPAFGASSPTVQNVSQGKGNGGSSNWGVVDTLTEGRLATLLTLLGVGLSYDGSGNLKVNVEAGGIGSNASVGTTGAAAPASGTYVGGLNGGNLVPLLVDASGRLFIDVNGTVPISSIDLGTAADAAWSGTGNGSLIAIQKAAYAQLAGAVGQSVPAGTNTIGSVVPKNALTNTRFSINLSASGAFTATPAAVAHLRQLFLVTSAACTIQVLDHTGGTALTGIMTLAAGQVVNLGFPAAADDSYYASTTGNALYLSIVGTTQISGSSVEADY